jgi:hypothetical protein
VADLHTALRFGHTLAPRRDELVAALEESAVRQADMFGADQQQRELFSRGRAPGALDSRFYQAVAHTLRDPALHGSLGQLDRFLDDTRALAEQHRPFHWPIEFSDVWFTERGSRETPGFDAVIGNPPYLRMERFKEIKPFLKAVYRTHESRADLYVYFVERAHRLLRGGGRLGMILSNKFLRANYGGPLRAFLAESTTVEEVVDFGGSGVFEGATVRPAIVLATATTGATKPLRFVAVRSLQFERLDRAVAEAVQAVPRAAVSGGTWRLLAAETETLLDRLAAVSIPLGEYVGGQICWGVKTGLNDAFWVERATRDRLLAANPEAAEVLRPLVVGDNVRRYHIESSERWLLYMHHGVDIGRYPAVERYLERFREKLEQRATKQAWYELQQPQEAYRSFLEGSKLLFPIITSTARFCIADGPLYPNDKCFFVPTDDSFLLALLNTKLMFSYLLHTAAKLEGSPGDNPFIELRAQYMTLVPIRRVSQQHAGDAEVRRRLVALAEELQADAVLAAIDTLLPLDEGGVPELDQEHSAPVRDLLAHLGRRMTELHRERQTIERVFTEWLAYSGTETARLPKAFREGGWAELAGAAEVLAEFQRRRVPLSAPQLGQLQREVANALDQLAPVRQRIAAFDDLIERVVRRLYGVAGDG